MKRKNVFVSFCSAAVLSVVAAVLVYLFAVSMLETVDMNMNNRILENVDFCTDRLWVNLLTLAALTVAALVWMRITNRLSARVTTAACVVAVAVLGTVFVLSSQSAPTQDSLIVSRAAYQAAKGDSTGIASDYFIRFPFQLGYVLFAEGVIRLFRTGQYYMIFEVINVICLAVTYLSLLRVVRMLDGKGAVECSRAVNLCAFLMLIFLPPMLFCSFTYGNLPGLMCAVLAARQMLCMQGKSRKAAVLHAVLAALFIGLGVALKKNMMIIFAAMAILLVIRFIRKPTAADVLCLALCILSVWGIPAGVQAQYEHRFGLEFGKGIPMSSWAAMGLNESVTAPGWYNASYTVVNFRESGNDPSEAGKRSAEVIRERLKEFRNDPAGALHFFSVKIRSEWNEPSYQSIWTNQVRGQYGEKVIPAAWICGNGETSVKGFMNAVVQFIFLLSALSCLSLLKHRRMEDAFFAICVLGGFLYHAIFEAKSQYILTYMILLLPLAAVGVGRFSGRRG